MNSFRYLHVVSDRRLWNKITIFVYVINLTIFQNIATFILKTKINKEVLVI